MTSTIQKENKKTRLSSSSKYAESKSSRIYQPERVSQLSVSEFINDFQKPRVPVIFRDATKDWAALDWTPELIRSRCLERSVVCRNEDGEHSIPIPELIEGIENSSIEKPFEYARNINIQSDLPELWDDIQPRLKYAQGDRKSSKLLPKDFILPNGLEEFFFGGAGASFPKLHVDYWGMDGFVSQIYNRKEFVLVSPSYSDCLYAEDDGGLTSRIENVQNPDFEKYPKFADAKVMRFDLHPGETLYMPNGWWHTTFMPETSITVITATWNAQNWSTFCQQYRERANVSKLKKVAMLAYLKAVGVVLGSFGK